MLKIKTPHLFLSWFSFIAVLTAAFTASIAAADPSKAPLKVVATTGMIADLAEEVGGDRVDVAALMGPGVDPHLYKATLSDLQQLQRADLILYNGLHLEGKMAEVLEKLAKKKPSVAVASGIDTNLLLQPPEYEGQYDPHVWFDIKLWIKAMEAVTLSLSEQRPEDKQFFESNAAAYMAELLRLDEWIREQIASIPKAQRVLITAHDAFGYFGKAYDIEVMGLQGLSTASEFGLHDLKRLVDVIIDRRIKAVFVESSVPQKFILALKEGVQARGAEVALGGELFSDAMGEKGTPEGRYTGMLRHNVSTIVQALR
ncbi:MAG: zinc ABC transporter substrate-binding protein [Deltaproteobacteria bacterium]|nr:zinc ABC transporter substrate-binding protein [Deltaproteobacteria bacterium]